MGNFDPAMRVTVVSGLPRSGTSMMMAMLEKGGMDILSDHIRKADDDNPKGYYEFEKVKTLEKDASFIAGASGKVIKVISMLLYHLPAEMDYKIIFMQRDMDEILASQKKMLERRGGALMDDIGDPEMKARFWVHLKKVGRFMAERENMDLLYVRYNDLLENPVQQAEKIEAFLGLTLNRQEMSTVIDRSLYRQRRYHG